ncbi:MAG TPA: CBS domain-containing protein [Actinomycetota bacterium]|nr:CBS domain-containing protein [Actinomycetota bacterium]
MQRTVNDVMTRTVVVVGESAPFKEIVRLMREYRVGALPVVDADGALVGVVTEGDLLLKGDPELHDPPRLFEPPERRAERSKARGLVAGQLMTSPACTVNPDATIAESARLMRDRGVKRLPVLAPSGLLVGIVSQPDLLKVFTRPDFEIEREVVHEIIEGELSLEPGTVRARVRDGVVVLDGQLERRALVPALVDRVRAVDGVVAVESRLSYRPGRTEDVPVPVTWERLAIGAR